MKIKQHLPLWAIFILTFILNGCATNPFQDYYEAVSIPAYKKAHLQYLVDKESPTLTVSTNDYNAELEEAQAHGMVIIGTSSFNAPIVEINKLSEQAKLVGATHVLYKVSPAGQITGFAPQIMTKEEASAMSKQTTHHPPSQSSDNNNSYTSTEDKAKDNEELFWGLKYLPVSYNKQRFDQSATFLVRDLQIPVLGLKTQSLTSDQKRRLGSNHGVIVKRVFYDSPGFAADIQKGDILYRVNGITIENEQHFHTIATRYSGTQNPMIFEILRGNTPIQVYLNPLFKRPSKILTKEPVLPLSKNNQLANSPATAQIAPKNQSTLPILTSSPNSETKLSLDTPSQKTPDKTPLPANANTLKNEIPSQTNRSSDIEKTPIEEKQAEAAKRWAVRKKAYDARIKKKQARAKDGFLMKIVHSMSDWFSDD